MIRTRNQQTHKSYQPTENSVRAAVLCASLLAVCAVVSLTPAAHSEIHEEAIFEVSLGAGLSTPSGDLSEYTFLDETFEPSGGLIFHASGGYFFTDLLSVGLALSYTGYGMDMPALADQEGRKFRFYTVALYGKYHFGYEAKLTPYVRGSVGLTFPNLVTPLVEPPGEELRELSYDPVLDASLAIGGRYSTNEWSGIFLEVAYRMVKLDGSGSDYSNVDYELPLDASSIDVLLGVSFDIGPRK